MTKARTTTRRRSAALPRGVAGERRRQPRTRVEVGCQAVTDYDFVLLGERIVDLSTRGLLLRSEGVSAELGERVILSFQAPGSAQWIDVEAEIVRLINGTAPGAPGYGLELVTPLSPFERGLLEAALERARRRPGRPAPRPRRPRRRPRVDAVRQHDVRTVGAVDGAPDLARRIVVVA